LPIAVRMAWSGETTATRLTSRQADLPGDAGDAAPTEHPGRALLAHRVILTHEVGVDTAGDVGHSEGGNDAE
jgi:hypothetical protein